MTDWAALYHDHVGAISSMADGLDDTQLAMRVPGTPLWTVHDVYSHLAGGPADQLAGQTEDAPGPEWTARHVSARQALPLAELVRELQSNAEAIAETVVDNPTPALVWDIAVHHADLHEALQRGPLPEHLWAPIVPMLAPRMLGKLPISLSSGDATYGAGGDAAEVTPYELFRAMFSRRSRSQMRAWGGDALSAEQLDGLCIFGARDDDQPIPA